MSSHKPHGLTGQRNAAKSSAVRLDFRPAVRLAESEKQRYKQLAASSDMTERELFISRFPEITG